MADIVIIEDESMLLDALTVGLSNSFPQFSIEGANCVEDIADQIEHTPPQLIISDIKLPGKSGLNFLMETRVRHPATKFILMSAFASVSPEEAQAQGALQLMQKPFPFKNLIHLVQESLCMDSFGGCVEGLSLVELMQLLHWGKRSSIISVEGQGTTGKIHFLNGEVIHAEKDGEEGIPAFQAFVQLNRGYFIIKSAEENPPTKTTIHDAFQKLVLDALRLFDEDGPHGVLGTLAVEESADSAKTPHSLATGNDGQPMKPRKHTMIDKVNELCTSIIEENDGVLACGVVDKSTESLLGLHHIVPQFSQTDIDGLAGEVGSLFRACTVRRMDSMLSRFNDAEAEELTDELFINSPRVFLFVRNMAAKNVIIFIVTEKKANQGMGWIALRLAAPKLAEVLP